MPALLVCYLLIQNLLVLRIRRLHERSVGGVGHGVEGAQLPTITTTLAALDSLKILQIQLGLVGPLLHRTVRNQVDSHLALAPLLPKQRNPPPRRIKILTQRSILRRRDLALGLIHFVLFDKTRDNKYKLHLFCFYLCINRKYGEEIMMVFFDKTNN